MMAKFQPKSILDATRKRIYEMYRNAERGPGGKICQDHLRAIRDRFHVSNCTIRTIVKEFESQPPVQE